MGVQIIQKWYLFECRTKWNHGEHIPCWLWNKYHRPRDRCDREIFRAFLRWSNSEPGFKFCPNSKNYVVIAVVRAAFGEKNLNFDASYVQDSIGNRRSSYLNAGLKYLNFFVFLLFRMTRFIHFFVYKHHWYHPVPFITIFKIVIFLFSITVKYLVVYLPATQ